MKRLKKRNAEKSGRGIYFQERNFYKNERYFMKYLEGIEDNWSILKKFADNFGGNYKL